MDHPPIGLVPAGKANSTLVSLRSVDPKFWLDTIIHTRTYTRMDLGKGIYGKKQQTRYMLKLFEWGLGVDVNIRAETMRWLGKGRFDVGTLVETMMSKARYVKSELQTSDH